MSGDGIQISVETTHPRVTVVRVYRTNPDEPVRVLLMSDLHIDSVHCRRKVLLQHLEEARRRGAIVLIAGDLVDAMQGRADPRRGMEEIIEELRRDDYYDAVVNYAANALAPIADRLAMIGYGNHETAVLRHRNTDLVQRIVHELRGRGSPVVAGAYGGWVLLRIYRTGAPEQRPQVRATLRIYYHHGATAGAPVTKGTIESERMAAYVGRADVVWAGHNHRHYTLMSPVEEVTERGVAYTRPVWYIRTPGYKDAWSKATRGFEMEKRHGPRPLGSVLLNIHIRGSGPDWQRVHIVPEEWITSGGTIPLKPNIRR